jgi:predicted metal-binding membrane protein
LLFPIGVMNLVAMLLITALIFAEKALPAGERTARFAAAALIGYPVGIARPRPRRLAP